MDICLDLETGGLRPSSAIFSIGAVKFDPLSDAIVDRFHFAISPDQNDLPHTPRTFDGSTIQWWTCQPTPFAQLAEIPQRTYTQVVQEFTRFCLGAEHIWANSPTFDVSMLRHLYTQLNQRFPFAYFKERDIRTLKALLPPQRLPAFEGTPHNALDDAAHEARIVQTVMRNLCLLPDNVNGSPPSPSA